MEKRLKIYEVSYASGMFRNNQRQTATIYSEKDLNIGDFVVVEHIDCGIFIGQVVEDTSEEYYYCFEGTNVDVMEDLDYRYLQHIDLSKYLDSLAKQKRKEELKKQMQHEFIKIDEKKKYEFYASLDENFKKIYEEYKELED